MDTDKYIGIPFVPNGRDPEKGLDCYGLVIEVFRDVYDITLPEFTDWDGTNTGACDAIAAGVTHRKLERCAQENAVLFTQGRAMGPHHIGVVVGDYGLHTTKALGCVMQPLSRMSNLEFFKWLT